MTVSARQWTGRLNFSRDISGKTVWIKPNAPAGLGCGRSHCHASVRASGVVVDKVETMNPAAIVVGDNTGVASYGANEACFEQTGLMAAAKGYYQNIGNDPVTIHFEPEWMP
ncbi:MAG: hypothetical protein R2860_17205 [Desulfobacterales bacterium]